MTNILTNLVSALSILVLTKTNAPMFFQTCDAPPCEVCGQVHHEIQRGSASVVEQRFLVGTVNGEPIKLLMTEKLLREEVGTNVAAKVLWRSPVLVPGPNIIPLGGAR